MPKKIKLNGPVIGDGSTWLYDWLGMPYISAKRLAKELDDARGDEVELYINSPGGSVFAGSEVYTILKEYAGKIVAKVTGVAASAASFFLMAADEIKMSPTSQLMIHNAATWTDGDKNAHGSNTEMLRGTDIAITNAYRLKTGKSQDELLELMNKTTWMNAQQAVEFGFADGILFDEDNALMSVTNSISGEIPPHVEEKLRDFLVNAMLKEGSVDLSSIMPGADITPILNNMDSPGQQQNYDDQFKEEEKPMDLDELKAKHPDVYQAACQEGIEQERNRIKEIDEISATIDPDLVNKAKYTEPIDAGKLAVLALKNDAGRGEAFINARQQELQENSGVKSQDNLSEEDQKKVNETAHIDAIANAINARRGGTEANK
jgi:ATP-dependent protease ClpP protease subunit